MTGFFESYGSLLFLAGIVGFMVWSHSGGRGGCCGGGQRKMDETGVSDKGARSGGGSCH